VVISTLGNYSGLRRMLDRLEVQDAEPGSFEVLVVASVAESDPAAVERAIGTRPYPVRNLTETPGLASNRNLGWRAADAPIVLFTDNDTLPERRLISEHSAWHRRHPEEEVGVLGHVRWARELGVTPFMLWLDRGLQLDYPNIDGMHAGWGRFYGANISVKKRMIERVGGFDAERLPYPYDDLDFGYRAHKLGFRLVYNRRAVVEHLRGMDLDFWRTKMRRLAVAERAYVRTHPRIPPYFYRRFTHAAQLPPARGRGARLLRLVPRWLPWLGRRVWTSADLYYLQALAPDFLWAWEEDSARERSTTSARAR
jgi:GT2 family glycosyltransferase